MSKRRNRQRRMNEREAHAMLPIPTPSGDALTLDDMPAIMQHAIHALGNALEKAGCDRERATDAAFVHCCWAARVAGVWPAIVDEAHGVSV